MVLPCPYLLRVTTVNTRTTGGSLYDKLYIVSMKNWLQYAKSWSKLSQDWFGITKSRQEFSSHIRFHRFQCGLTICVSVILHSALYACTRAFLYSYLPIGLEKPIPTWNSITYHFCESKASIFAPTYNRSWPTHRGFLCVTEGHILRCLLFLPVMIFSLLRLFSSSNI